MTKHQTHPTTPAGLAAGIGITFLLAAVIAISWQTPGVPSWVNMPLTVGALATVVFVGRPAYGRSWRWVAGGGLLGLAPVVGPLALAAPAAVKVMVSVALLARAGAGLPYPATIIRTTAIAAASVVARPDAPPVSAPAQVPDARGPPRGSRLPVGSASSALRNRPAPQPDTVATLAQIRAVRAARQAAAPVATSPQPPKRHRAVALPHQTLQGDLLYARRADVWAPQPAEAVRKITRSDGQPLAEIATTITYRDSEEGTILYTLPVDGTALPRLGPWEQGTLFAVCDRFVRGGCPLDDTIRWPSMRVLGRAVLGREPTGPEKDRIEHTLRMLATTTIHRGSADLAVEIDRKGRSHVVRTETEDIYHLLESLHIERKGRAASTAAGQPRKLSTRAISLRLPAVVTARLRAGIVATMRASVIHDIGLRDETTLRLYSYLCSQRFAAGRVSQEVIEQIVRPTDSWGPRAHPAKFRRRVERMAKAVRGDPRFTIAFESRRGGGWNILWSRTDRKKKTTRKR